MLFLCFVELQLIFLGSLIFKGVSRSPATSLMEPFSILVYNFLLITNIARISVLDIAEALDPPLLLKVSFFRVLFL